MAEYIIDTTQAERDYENMFSMFVAKFDRLLGCSLGEEIVHCKDCEYFENNEASGLHYCWLFDTDTRVNPDGFCAWGKWWSR